MVASHSAPVFSPAAGGSLIHVSALGGTLAVEDSGPPCASGQLCDVALLIPGMGDLRQSYRYLGPILLSQGFRVLVMDLRGQGQSSVTFESYTPLDIAHDIITVLEQLCGGMPAVLVANDIAGASAVAAAAMKPNLVRAIVGLSPILFDQSSDAFVRPLSRLLFCKAWGVATWVNYYDSLFSKTPPDFVEYKEGVRNNLHEEGRLNALSRFARGTKTPCWKMANVVRCPVLILIGADDPAFSNAEEAGAQMVAGLSSAKPIEMSLMLGLGHYPHVEHADEVAEALLGFLSADGQDPEARFLDQYEV